MDRILSSFSCKALWQSGLFRAALWKLAFCLCFSLSNALVKGLRLPVVEIACLENFMGGLLLTGSVKKVPWGLVKDPRGVSRTFISLVSMVSWAYAIKTLPLFQTVALGFMGPFFTVMGAYLFLGEAFSPRRLVAILLAVVGGFLIVHGPALFCGGTPCPWWSTWVPFLAAFSSSTSNILSKRLLQSAFSPQEIAWFLMVSSGSLLLLTVPVWVQPTVREMCVLTICGAVLAGAHFFMGKAFSEAELTLLVPIGSVKLLLGAWMGVFFFGEYPTWWMLAGSCIILAALSILSGKNRGETLHQKTV